MADTAITNIINGETKKLNTHQAAEIIGVKPETLVSWRCTKKQKIPYYKIGRMVFYAMQDITEFIEKKRVE